MPSININQYHPSSGRVIKEDDRVINIADLLQMSHGLPLAALNNEAGIFSADLSVSAGETAALNIYFDLKVVVSKVALPNNGLTPVIRKGEATGDYADIINPSGLNLIEAFSDDSQAQIVYNASHSGVAMSGNGVDNSIVTDASEPLSVTFTNNTGADIDQPIVVKFFKLGETSTLTLLQSDTQLESTTEMSDYGAN